MIDTQPSCAARVTYLENALRDIAAMANHEPACAQFAADALIGVAEVSEAPRADEVQP